MNLLYFVQGNSFYKDVINALTSIAYVPGVTSCKTHVVLGPFCSCKDIFTSISNALCRLDVLLMPSVNVGFLMHSHELNAFTERNCYLESNGGKLKF